MNVKRRFIQKIEALEYTQANPIGRESQTNRKVYKLLTSNNNMITQIKKRGDSFVIVLTKELRKFHGFEEGDWVDVSSIMKVEVEI